MGVSIHSQLELNHLPVSPRPSKYYLYWQLRVTLQTQHNVDVYDVNLFDTEYKDDR
ncbi:MAG: hypothetical protein ACK4QL_04255 [Pseudanabaenaceae cyanobacterium]